MSIYQNEGATCPTCIWQEPALQGDITAKYQCKKCRNKNGRPGWDPKPNINITYSNVVGQNGKRAIIRRVVP